jgi:tRNA A22 N-methylase
MDVGFQEVIDSRVNHAVTRQRGDAAECLGNDADPEVAVSVGCAGMAGVQMTLVLDDEKRRCKTAFQAMPQPLRTAGISLSHMFA